jgi:hypothetical protein
MYANTCCSFKRQKCGKEEAGKVIKYKDLIIGMVHVECKNESDISNNGATGTTSKSFRKCPSNLV